MEQASLRLIQSLQSRGHEIELLSLNAIGGLAPLLQATGISHEGLRYSGLWGWRTSVALRRRLRRCPADALLFIGNHLLASLALGGFCAGRRILAVHFHHAGVKPPWQWRLIYKVACRKFRAITFPSDFIRREASMLWPPLGSLAHTVRNPLPLPEPASPESKANARRALGLPEDCLIVGNAGWVIRRKRFDVFVRVAHEVVRMAPKTFFLVAGSGPELPNLQEATARLGIDARFRWLGWQGDLRTFYQSIDINLFNSDWDALPTTPQEAMAHGVPVVASVENGGLSEILVSGKNGFLFPAHDVKALANTVVTLMRDAALASSIGKAGRQTISQLCDPDSIAAQYERLLLAN